MSPADPLPRSPGRPAVARGVPAGTRRYTFRMVGEETLRLWEFASYVVTVIGLPVAVMALWREARGERANERKEIEQRDEETYLQLSEQYTAFIESVLRYPELGLHPRLPVRTGLSPEDEARRRLFFEMLIALFERAYILLHEESLDAQGARRWQSWADFMAEWCGRADFRAALPDLLHGEDPAFSHYIRALAQRAAR
jgi:hypothetical protein